MKSGRLRRGMVIFLLTFAFFDLTIVDMFFPQLCGDEQAAPSVAGPVESTEDPADESAAIRDQDSQPSRDSHQLPIDEDCFCCCSHIIPSPYVNVAALNNPPQPGDPAVTSLPLAPPRGTFHPPRLA